MARCSTFHPSATWQALFIFSVIAVHAEDRETQVQCPDFSCGDLHNISYPFHRPGDPPQCGVQEYQLVCSSGKPRIHINTGTYFVTNINYTSQSFRVVDANLDMHNSCPLPRWDHYPVYPFSPSGYWACFVNCSRAITGNNLYKPVKCLSSNNSFFYVHAKLFSCSIGSLEPSCGYMAMIPFSMPTRYYLQPENATYADIIESVKEGFVVDFPALYSSSSRWDHSMIVKDCLNGSVRSFHDHISGGTILKRTLAFFRSGITFVECINYNTGPTDSLHWVSIAMVSAMYSTELLAVLCRLVLPALVVFTFLDHKYWKTRITVDAVEKFLQMQQMLGPIRFAYTDITAITSHFRDKLGQGGYGCVYRGVLLPGNVQVAVKMLGNSNCNGDEFISEVSTIGRIHHINVVRLVGFCAEEMRRALVYEYMPHGSLDKYIFSSDRSFSWDKLNDIAVGIARGINYLHLGCDMQILHFDIKPHNILLDGNFVPKVADFGLAKLYPRDKSFVPSNALRGTIGYIAPEMVSRSFGVISSKSDVYSFGMMLLEMAGGRRNADQNAGNSSQAYYPSWVYDHLAKQEVGEISAATDMHKLERKLCIVGLRCIQMKPQDRPTMGDVIEMLESGTGGLQMPSRPFFCDGDHMTAADSCHFSSELTEISEEDE